jgi:O-antigen/teichoic acid export membrane protein
MPVEISDKVSTRVGRGLPLAGRRSDLISTWRRGGLFNFGWMGLSQVIGLVLRLMSNVVLARLLAPEDYGVFATAMAVVVTLEWFSDLGVLPALLRHPQGHSRAYLCTGWWIGMFRGIALTTLAGALAMPLAGYYHQPGLLYVLVALATRSTLYALRSPGMPVLRRELNYRAVFFEEISLMLVGTGVSLTLAYLTRSVWAIVGGTLAGVVAAVVTSYILRPGLPGWTWDRKASADLSHMGRQIFFNTALMALWMNADRLVGLHFVTPLQMGLYAVAWNLSSVLEGLALHSCDVYFSMLSRINDLEARAAWHRRVCERIVIWAMPLLAVGVILAPVAIRVLYDRRYAGAGVIFAILMARLMARILGLVQFQHLLATGEVWIATRAFFVALVVQGTLLATLGRSFGVIGIASSGLASTIVLTGTQAAMIHFRGERGLRPLFITLLYIGISILIVLILFHSQARLMF